MSFLTPTAGLVALIVVVPLAAFVRSERARRRVTEVLGLGEPTLLTRATPAVAIVVAAAALGLAATQPTIVAHAARTQRTDAQVWLLLDTSLSMNAAPSRHGKTRFQRSLALALRLRSALGNVPVGIASLTDRVLPHVFPTTDANTFGLTLRKVVGIERPPPLNGFSSRITQLGAIASIVTGNFFPTSVKHRLIVVFTDGETRPVADRTVSTVFRQPPGVRSIYVRIWGAHEHVWFGSRRDPVYRPDPTSAQNMSRLAAATDGVAVDSSHFDELVSDARDALGSGPTEVLKEEKRRLALAPYFAGLAFLPLGFLVWRRNL
jgi:hypothetical protein